MKIRAKVFFIVVAVFGVLFFGISNVFTKIEAVNFQKLERQAVLDNISRIDLALEGRFDDLSVKLSDWSQWDDTYAFVQDRNDEYLISNLQDETLTQLRLNFILIKDASGEIVFEKYILNNKKSQFPQDLKKAFLNSKIDSLSAGSPEVKVSGIVHTENGPFILAAQPISSSDGSAQPKGLMVFGYAADEHFVEALSKATVLKLSQVPAAEASKQNVFALASGRLNLNNRTYIDETPAQNIISGYLLKSDVFGDPGVIFRAEIPRDIYNVGLENTKRLDMFLVLIGIFEVLVILILFELFVFRKISKLAQGVKRVNSKNHRTERLVIEGKDEFAELNRDINGMLDAISSTLAEKKESESRFMNIADSAPVMIWVSDSSNKIIYVNNALVKFLGKSEDELLGDAWTRVIHPDDKSQVLETFGQAAEKQEPLSVRYRVSNAQGGFKWILVEAVPRKTMQGVFRGYIGTSMDMTLFEENDEKSKYLTEIGNLKALNKELEKKVAELEKK